MIWFDVISYRLYHISFMKRQWLMPMMTETWNGWRQLLGCYTDPGPASAVMVYFGKGFLRFSRQRNERASAHPAWQRCLAHSFQIWCKQAMQMVTKRVTSSRHLLRPKSLPAKCKECEPKKAFLMLNGQRLSQRCMSPSWLWALWRNTFIGSSNSSGTKPGWARILQSAPWLRWLPKATTIPCF